MKRTYIALTCAALSLGACTSAGPEPLDGSALSADVATLPELDVVEWGRAIASCEGVIDGTESYAVARPDGLVVAIGARGAICVDTLPAMQEELAAIGIEQRAEDLARRYWATFDAHPVSRSTSSTAAPPAGEPNPQPSVESITAVQVRTPIADGEPNPQPSGPAGGEPNPQPSGENDEGSSDTGTSPADGTKAPPPPPMPTL